MGRDADQVESIIADETARLPGETVFARRLLEFSNQGIPIEMKATLPFAALQNQLKAMHREDQFQGLHPADFDPQGKLLSQIGDLGLVFAANGFQSK
jgi:hypothetical protein